jgi:hypothetical protein
VYLPILIGGGIYSLWRSKQLMVFRWYRWVGLTTAVEIARERLAGIKHFIPAPILYSLPDALWVYSFTALMYLLWLDEPPGYERALWILLPVSMGIGAEFGQLLKVVPGTFDWSDVLAYVAAFVSASIFMHALRKKPETCYRLGA